MSTVLKVVVLLASLLSAGAAELLSTNDAEGAQWRRIAERMRVEMGISNFLLMTNFPVARSFIVDPSFGIYWDEVPPPTLTNSAAMAQVNAFIATNGWNMHTGRLVFSYGTAKPKPIRGLPWQVIQDREFPALTHHGVLYIVLKGWHHNLSGVAYNPNTNSFADAITGFSPLSGHWYTWAQSEDPITLPRMYEDGSVAGRAPVNGSQPTHSQTNRSSTRK